MEKVDLIANRSPPIMRNGVNIKKNRVLSSGARSRNVFISSPKPTETPSKSQKASGVSELFEVVPSSRRQQSYRKERNQDEESQRTSSTLSSPFGSLKSGSSRRPNREDVHSKPSSSSVRKLSQPLTGNVFLPMSAQGYKIRTRVSDEKSIPKQDSNKEPSNKKELNNQEDREDREDQEETEILNVSRTKKYISTSEKSVSSRNSKSEREYNSERNESELVKESQNEMLERKIALLQKQLKHNKTKKIRDEAQSEGRNVSLALKEKTKEMYVEQVKKLVEESENTENDPYPEMPRYDLMTDLEQVQAHAEYALAFKDIYRLLPDMDIVDPEASLESKYVVYQACYRRISVKNLSEIYRIVMAACWSVTECILERFIGNGFFEMQWKKRSKYNLALDRLAEKSFSKGGGVAQNPLYELIYSCGIDLMLVAVISVVTKLIGNQHAATFIINSTKELITTYFSQLDGAPDIRPAPGTKAKNPEPEESPTVNLIATGLNQIPKLTSAVRQGLGQPQYQRKVTATYKED